MSVGGMWVEGLPAPLRPSGGSAKPWKYRGWRCPCRPCLRLNMATRRQWLFTSDVYSVSVEWRNRRLILFGFTWTQLLQAEEK
jgi:hypothetical protein